MLRRSVFRVWGGFAAVALLFAFTAAARAEQPGTQSSGPTDAKARKTFANATNWEKQRDLLAALDDYRKANKQDGGHCAACLQHAYRLAVEIGDYKAAAGIMQDWLALVTNDADRATLHFQMGVALQRQGVAEKKDKYFTQSSDELKTALKLDPTVASAHYAIGVSLAYLHQDEAARAEFNQFLSQDKREMGLHPRAQRFAERVELARARMAPPFSITTIDGKSLSMDDLAGKVVLIDFWATWCGPCREALPHMRKIVQKFQGQPFVAISISLDKDEQAWKDFVAKNGMTWFQYRDGSFDGRLAKMFNVTAIPATFSIDADGVLEDEHVGDANIEGKLKKMIAQAAELQERKTASLTASKPSASQ